MGKLGKVLYAIQGTGNGHLSRANDIVPILKKKVDLDLLVSGIQADVSIPYEIKYRLRGMSFIFGKKGGVDIWDTFRKTDTRQLLKEIRDLPITEYKLVINDFEPVSAWAARKKNIPCISLSHQSAVLHKKAPKPKKRDWLGKQILKHYAPVEDTYGFHFESFDDRIFTPVIRQQVREQQISNEGHITVYLPAYSDEKIIKILSPYKIVKWMIFSKHTDKTYHKGNLFITPIKNDKFIESMATSGGVLCGAGFETPAEALYMGKKVMVIPMKSQYEQQCNAAALEKMGIPVIDGLIEKHLPLLEDWLNTDEVIPVNYPDNTESIIDRILDIHL